MREICYDSGIILNHVIMGFFDKLLGKKPASEPVAPPTGSRQRFEASGEIGARIDPMARISDTASRGIQAEGALKLEGLRAAADAMLSDARSEAEVAASMEIEEQIAIADAKHEAAARIMGIFNRIASEKHPISAIAALSNELGAIEADIMDTLEGPARKEALEVVQKFRLKLKEAYGG